MPRKGEKQCLWFIIRLLPFFDRHSRALILGSIPSPKSRETGFYYGHPQNRFWPLLSHLLNEELPHTNSEKKELLLKNHIALWDVLASCEIKGADDHSIDSPIPNDINWLLDQCPVVGVFTAGKKATELYRKFCYPQTGIESIYLPSTSPANRGCYPMERLLSDWNVLLKYISR